MSEREREFIYSFLQSFENRLSFFFISNETYLLCVCVCVLWGFLFIFVPVSNYLCLWGILLLEFYEKQKD